MAVSFKWPWQDCFPTFLMLQPNMDTGEAAGCLVLCGPVLLSLAQTVQCDRDGSSGEPALQQCEATAEAPCGLNPDYSRGTEEEREC